MGVGKRFSASVSAGDDPAVASLAALIAAEDFATQAELGSRERARLAVVVEELVSNAVRHGAAGGAITIELALDAADGQVALVLEDDGLAFDPTIERAFSGPDAETGGGVGLALVRAWANAFRYSRRAGRNRVELQLRAA
jgi:anti-sigma regulatory factor (Ser/Thr protein kinase)